MLKRILAAAIVATLFACSSDDNEDTPTTKPSSSSGGTTVVSSSSVVVEPVFELIHNFAERNDNTIGYAEGSATISNEDDMFLDEETGEEKCEIDPETQVCYKNWVPNGILTLKEFSYNDGTTSNSSGGLIIKNLGLIKDFTAFKFKVRATTAGTYQFRMKAEKEVEGVAKTGAWAQDFTISAANTFETITIEIDGNWYRIYHDWGGTNSSAFTYAFENATDVEFVVPFDLASGAQKQTLEIDDFEGKKK